MPRLFRMQVLLAAASGVVLGACTEDDARSAHNEAGPPRVTEVNVLSESGLDGASLSFFFGELATYCSPDSNERVNRIYCHDDQTEVTDAEPIGWYTRLVFNERLNGDMVEELLQVGTDANGSPILVGSLATTQPATLTCGGSPVAYDGYYDPTGSHLTDPPGPAIIVEPLDPDVPGAGYVGTNVDCQVAVKAEAVQDREFVAANPDKVGPFTFTTAKFNLDSFFAGGALHPGVFAGEDVLMDGAEGVSPSVEFAAVFNGYVADATGWDPSAIELVDSAGSPVSLLLTVEGTDVVITPEAELAADTTYTLRVSAGIGELMGDMFEPAEPIVLSFTTGAGS